MKAITATIYYFDTSALRALNFQNEIARILDACKRRELAVCLSEWVIYEYARKEYERELENSVSAIYLAENFPRKTRREILESRREILDRYIVGYRRLFEAFGVTIILHTREIDEVAQRFLDDGSFYFTASKENDRRDARILASAISALNPNQTTVLCQENRKLTFEFARRGYRVEQNPKEIFVSLQNNRDGARTRIPRIADFIKFPDGEGISEIFHRALQEHDSTYSELHLPLEIPVRRHKISLDDAKRIVSEMGSSDNEIRLKSLAYIFWFAPASKEDLIAFLGEHQISKDLARHNLNLLVATSAIKDTGSYYLPGEDGVCAAVGSSRIGELAELVRGS